MMRKHPFDLFELVRQRNRPESELVDLLVNPLRLCRVGDVHHRGGITGVAEEGRAQARKRIAVHLAEKAGLAHRHHQIGRPGDHTVKHRPGRQGGHDADDLENMALERGLGRGLRWTDSGSGTVFAGAQRQQHDLAAKELRGGFGPFRLAQRWVRWREGRIRRTPRPGPRKQPGEILRHDQFPGVVVAERLAGEQPARARQMGGIERRAREPELAGLAVVLHKRGERDPRKHIIDSGDGFDLRDCLVVERAARFGPAEGVPRRLGGRRAGGRFLRGRGRAAVLLELKHQADAGARDWHRGENVEFGQGAGEQVLLQAEAEADHADDGHHSHRHAGRGQRGAELGLLQIAQRQEEEVREGHGATTFPSFSRTQRSA